MDTLAILQEVREVFVGDSLMEFASHKAALHWVRQKHGAAKMKAHRNFVKMVRADPAAHHRKMRMNKRYHARHKFHDKIMRRTARKGYRRVHGAVEDLRRYVDERGPGQAFMDLPFELRVTEKTTKKKRPHGPPAPPDIQKTIARYYDDVRKNQPGKSKEYAARVAWTRFCKYKNPDHPSCK